MSQSRDLLWAKEFNCYNKLELSIDNVGIFYLELTYGMMGDEICGSFKGSINRGTISENYLVSLDNVNSCKNEIINYMEQAKFESFVDVKQQMDSLLCSICKIYEKRVWEASKEII